jgi:hypothetical protein
MSAPILRKAALHAVRDEIERAKREGDMYDEQRPIAELNAPGHPEWDYESVVEAVHDAEAELDV